jgi:hypothetical protein
MWNRTGIGRVLAAAAVLGGLASLGLTPAAAVVILGGDGSGNTSMPPYPSDSSFPGTGFPGTDPGWNNVGLNSNEAAIYVGQQWVLMAYHGVVLSNGNPVSQGVDFAGTVYFTNPTTLHRLYDPSQPGTLSDLVLLKLTTAPSLLGVTISAASPATNAWVVGMGQGPASRSASIVYWNSSGNLVSGPTGAAYSGFTYNSTTRVMRWGDAQVGGTESAVSDGSDASHGSYGLTDCFYTTFANNGNPNEMQAGLGDSGGGVFSWNGTSWQLSGMIIGTNDPSGIFTKGVAFGSSTYMADLSQYRSQITGVVPEPSTVALLLAGGAVFWTCRRFRARGRR